MTTTSVLTSKHLVLVFALANAGLGHLRVTNALYEGLPKEASGVLLGAQGDSTTFFHRLTSVNPTLREVAEYIQQGWAEDVFTYFYRDFLRGNTKTLYGQIRTIIEQQVEQPKKLMMVATHFGLAHQMAVIKDRLEKGTKIKVGLVVVVTDDSPQHIWAVGGADLIFVPSKRTKNALVRYHKKQKMKPSKYVVVPYCVSLTLAENLKNELLKERLIQADCCSVSRVHVAIPISGAAVQLGYFESLVDGLARKSERFRFYIVSRKNRHTHKFLDEMLVRKDTTLLVSENDREVVDLYEDLYVRQRILLEVTKPSEQAFKCLLSPRTVGGSILLFSQPVGRQEYDNVNFMRRHDLMPDKELQVRMWKAAWNNEGLSGNLWARVTQEVKGWRGLRLPHNPEESITFILWCLQEKVFEKMMNFKGYEQHPELSADGVKIFWEKVSEHVQEI